MQVSALRRVEPVGRILTALLVLGSSLGLAGLLSLDTTTTAQAAPITYIANLSGPAESPANASPGSGFSQIDIDVVAHTLRVQATFSGLLAPTTASHIHACTAAPLAGTAGIATQTPSFIGFPLGVTSGSFDRTFDTLDAATYNASFVTANGGTPAGAEAALATCLAAGRAYLNVHSTLIPAGEIRGFGLQPAPGRNFRVTSAPSIPATPAGVSPTSSYRLDWDGPVGSLTQTLTRFTVSGQTNIPIAPGATTVTDRLGTTKEIACWLYRSSDSTGVTRVQGPLYCSQPKDGGPAAPVPEFTVVQTSTASQAVLTGGLALGATGALIVAFQGTGVRTCASFQPQPCAPAGLVNGLNVNFVPGVGFNAADLANGGNPTYYVAIEYDAALQPVAQGSTIMTFPNSLVLAGVGTDPEPVYFDASALMAADLLCHLFPES